MAKYRDRKQKTRAGGWAEEWELGLSRDRGSASREERAVEMDGGEGSTTTEMYLRPLKNGSNSKFCYVYFTRKMIERNVIVIRNKQISPNPPK